jgi:hypothetical protein
MIWLVLLASLVLSVLAVCLAAMALVATRQWELTPEALDPELQAAFEEFRKDRTVVHACVEFSTKKIFHVIEVQHPRMTPDKARNYQILAARIREKGWYVEGVPIMPPQEPT